MTTTEITKGQIVIVDRCAETATVVGFVIDQDESMVVVRWNGSGKITHEYPSEVVAA